MRTPAQITVEIEETKELYTRLESSMAAERRWLQECQVAVKQAQDTLDEASRREQTTYNALIHQRSKLERLYADYYAAVNR